MPKKPQGCSMRVFELAEAVGPAAACRLREAVLDDEASALCVDLRKAALVDGGVAALLVSFARSPHVRPAVVAHGGVLASFRDWGLDEVVPCFEGLEEAEVYLQKEGVA